MSEPEAAVADPARLIAASRPLSEPPNYDGVLFSAVQPGPEHANGHYHQEGDLITVEIDGGSVRTGRLVGRVDAGGVLEASYCMVLSDGEVIAGRCVSTPSLLPDGRLLLTERWNRIDGSSGVSYIASLPHQVGDENPADRLARGVRP
jgi:hypothetical protein